MGGFKNLPTNFSSASQFQFNARLARSRGLLHDCENRWIVCSSSPGWDFFSWVLWQVSIVSVWYLYAGVRCRVQGTMVARLCCTTHQTFFCIFTANNTLQLWRQELPNFRAQILRTCYWTFFYPNIHSFKFGYINIQNYLNGQCSWRENIFQLL